MDLLICYKTLSCYIDCKVLNLLLMIILGWNSLLKVFNWLQKNLKPFLLISGKIVKV